MSGSDAIPYNTMSTEMGFDVSRYCCNDLAIIAFEPGGNKVEGRYKGLPVYPHKDYELIRQGEKWLCELQPNTVKNYFAIPIRKVDASLLFELLPEQRRDMTRILLEDYPEDVSRLLAHEMPEDAVRREPDTGDQQASAEDAESMDVHETEVPDEHDEGMGQEPDQYIIRAGQNTLESPLFTEPAYDVFISRDRRVIRICPKNGGLVRCRDRRISLVGLNDIIPEEMGRIFMPIVDDRTGKIIVAVE